MSEQDFMTKQESNLLKSGFPVYVDLGRVERIAFLTKKPRIPAVIGTVNKGSFAMTCLASRIMVNVLQKPVDIYTVYQTLVGGLLVHDIVLVDSELLAEFWSRVLEESPGEALHCGFHPVVKPPETSRDYNSNKD